MTAALPEIQCDEASPVAATRRKRGAVGAIWVAVFAIVLATEVYPFIEIPLEFWPAGYFWQRGIAERWTFFLVGLLMWRLRPENRTWKLLLAVGFAGLPFRVGHVPLPDIWAVELLLTGMYYAVLLHLILAYPKGALPSRPDRIFVGLAYSSAAVFTIMEVLGTDPLTHHGCPPIYCQNPAYIIRSPEYFPTLGIASELNAVAFLLGFIALVVWRFLRTPPPIRPLLRAMLVAAFFFAIVGGIQAGPLWRLVSLSEGTRLVLDFVITGLVMLIPITFLVGLLLMRLTQAQMGRFVIELEATPREQLRDSLARLLHDPSVDLAFWSSQLGRYIDGQGTAIDPAESAGGRTVTMIERGGEPVAAVMHDASLREEPGLLDAASAALGWTLDNERLQAELRAQLEETRASRARIVEAGDAERRRVERNLHDGAQQRLVTLSLMLRRARSQMEEDKELGGTLGKAVEELGTAIDELRDLAQGIHPSILSEEGLGPALESLVERAAAPATLAAAPTNRLPSAVEATAYFVVAEALTNVVKYAQASAVTISATQGPGGLVVEVVDDGVGGAQYSRGSGLRGLSDRVAALGGRLTIESPPGGGTMIVAELPCE